MLGMVIAASYGCAVEHGSGIGGGPGYTYGGGRACTVGFSRTGGGEYAVVGDYAGLALPVVFDRVAGAIHATGYQVAGADRSLGTMSATKTGMQSGDGRILVPLHARVGVLPRGIVRVELRYFVAQSIGETAESIRHDLCRMLALVAD
jgi:hypothetical protein